MQHNYCNIFLSAYVWSLFGGVFFCSFCIQFSNLYIVHCLVYCLGVVLLIYHSHTLTHTLNTAITPFVSHDVWGFGNKNLFLNKDTQTERIDTEPFLFLTSQAFLLHGHRFPARCLLFSNTICLSRVNTPPLPYLPPYVLSYESAVCV